MNTTLWQRIGGVLLVAGAMSAGATAFAVLPGCDDSDAEDVADDIGDAAHDAADEVGDAVDDAAD